MGRFLPNIKPWLIWLISGLFYLFEFIHRVAISVMVPELTADLQVSAASLGVLSAAYYYAYASAQIPVGYLLDKFGIRYLLSLSSIGIAVGSWLLATTDNLPLATIARIVIGLGSAFSFVGCVKLSSNWFVGSRLATIIGLTNLLGMVGAVIGGAPLARWVDMFGWRTIMQISAAIGLAFAVLLWVCIRDSPARPTDKSADPPKIRALMMQPLLWKIAVLGSFMVAPIATYTELWGVSFLMQTQALTRPDAAFIASLTFIGIAIGGPTIGWAADQFSYRHRLLQAGAGGALLSVLCLILWPGLDISWLTLLHLGFGFASSCMLLCFSLNTEFAPPKLRGTVIGFTNTVIMAVSASFQFIAGYLLDITHDNYSLALTPLLLCLGCAAIIAWTLPTQPAER